MSQNLSSMEDPTFSHVMPTALVKSEQVSTRNMLMLPPAGLPSKRKRKEVLEEEEYVEALSHIIERDYFPQLAASRSSDYEGSKLDGLSVDSFFQHYTSYDNDSFEELQEKSVEDHKRKYPWLYELPDDGSGKHRRSGMMMLYYLGDKVLTRDQRDKMEKIMNGPENVGDSRPNGSQPWRFRVRNQLMFPPELAVSEDICRMRDHETPDLAEDSYRQQQKSILPIDSNTRLMLTNGDGSEKSSLNSHTNNLAALQQALVRYNKRYSASSVRAEKTIQRNNTSMPASLSDSTTSGLTSEQLLSWDRSYRARQQLHQQSQYAHQNGHENLTIGRKLVLEEPHTPSLRSSGGGSTIGDGASECSDFAYAGAHLLSGGKKREYTTVPMSPCPEPGHGALQSLTPLFTWGSVEGTPLLLHQATPAPASSSMHTKDKHRSHSETDKDSDYRNANAAERRRMKALQEMAFEEEEKGLPRFALRPASHREQLAHSLDTSSFSSSSRHSSSARGQRSASSSGGTSVTSNGGNSRNRGETPRTSSIQRSVRRENNNKRSRSAEDDVSDEMSVDARKDYYRSANQTVHPTIHASAQPSPAASVHSVRTHASSSSRLPNSTPSTTSSSTLSAAQRLARLTPAARALALKLHKNLATPATPLG